MALDEISSKATSDNFVNKSLESLPRVVIVVFGVLFAFVIFLVGTGFNGAVIRIANAQAARLERGIDSLEVVVAKINTAEKATEALSRRVDAIDVRLQAVSGQVDQHIHKVK